MKQRDRSQEEFVGLDKTDPDLCAKKVTELLLASQQQTEQLKSGGSKLLRFSLRRLFMLTTLAAISLAGMRSLGVSETTLGFLLALGSIIFFPAGAHYCLLSSVSQTGWKVAVCLLFIWSVHFSLVSVSVMLLFGMQYFQMTLALIAMMCLPIWGMQLFMVTVWSRKKAKV